MQNVAAPGLLGSNALDAAGAAKDGVGEEQETSDIEIKLPSTGERAFVQIKSATSQSEFDKYRANSAERSTTACSTPTIKARFTTDSRITLLGPERLAKMIVEPGLVSWILDKVR